MTECRCTAFIFSGRPDPEWTTSQNFHVKLLDIWNSLEPTDKKFPPIPPLGYRGCMVKCEYDTEWFVYKTIVRLQAKKITEYRFDQKRLFEKMVVTTAPKGLIPLAAIDL
jgi:hypothetical protein